MTSLHSGGFDFSRFNLRKVYEKLIAHDIAIGRLNKAMTQANDALTALEQEFNDATNAIAAEIDSLHAEIAAGNQGAVDRLKPIADRLRDMGTGSTTPVTPSAGTTPSSDASNPGTTTGV